jgi:hypothetical protein
LFAIGDLVGRRKAEGLVIAKPDDDKRGALFDRLARSRWKRSRQLSGVGRRVGSTPSVSRCSGVDLKKQSMTMPNSESVISLTAVVIDGLSSTLGR